MPKVLISHLHRYTTGKLPFYSSSFLRKCCINLNFTLDVHAENSIWFGIYLYIHASNIDDARARYRRSIFASSTLLFVGHPSPQTSFTANKYSEHIHKANESKRHHRKRLLFSSAKNTCLTILYLYTNIYLKIESRSFVAE